MLRFLCCLIIPIFFFCLPSIAAEEQKSEDTGEESKLPIMYYEIEPNILTFYQDTSKKIGYIVVQIQVVVRGQPNFDLIELHLPLIQDTLIDFFNRQDKATVQDLKQRETLRTQAEVRVSDIIKEEIGTDIVENILFTQYVFQ